MNKRDWHKSLPLWGKRAWQSLQGGWGKRDAWGDSLYPAAEKRAWQNLQVGMRSLRFTDTYLTNTHVIFEYLLSFATNRSHVESRE